MHQLFVDFQKAHDSVRREDFYNILIQSGVLMELVRLIKVCLNEPYSRFRVGKHLSDVFPITNGVKQVNALSPVFFNFAVEYAAGRVQVTQDILKFNGTHQIVVYADFVNILGDSVNTTKKNAEALVFAVEKTGIELNVDKSKCMVTS